MRFLKVQLKSRLTFAKKYLRRDLHVCFPSDGEFITADLDAYRVSLPDGVADVVAAVETIEHLENPRAFLRELVRLTKPGGMSSRQTCGQSLPSAGRGRLPKRYRCYLVTKPSIPVRGANC